MERKKPVFKLQIKDKKTGAKYDAGAMWENPHGGYNIQPAKDDLDGQYPSMALTSYDPEKHYLSAWPTERKREEF